MKLILGTIALTCVLSVSALAGEIPTCNCKTMVAEFPTTGSPVAGKGEMPDADSTESSDTQTSLLTTVLLTLVSLAVR
jgi:hypothetical protein